ncbi:MAG: GAF domain-containing protein [Chitinophagales bacterium]
MHELVIDTQIDKGQKYEQLIPQIRAVIEGESDWIANLANIAAMLKECFDFFWVGFYRRVEDELVLGPFQGPLACTRIAMSRGVCGHAASEQKTVIVPNVHEFPGHIACSSLSNSEIVVPLVQNQKTVLILDIDSTNFNDFDDTDTQYLERVMALIEHNHPNISNQK